MQLSCKKTGWKLPSEFYKVVVVYPVVDDKKLNSVHKSVVTFSLSSLIFQQYKIGFKQELT